MYRECSNMVVCRKCYKPGHIQKDCMIYQAEYPKIPNQASTQSTQSITINKDGQIKTSQKDWNSIMEEEQGTLDETNSETTQVLDDSVFNAPEQQQHHSIQSAPATTQLKRKYRGSARVQVQVVTPPKTGHR